MPTYHKIDQTHIDALIAMLDNQRVSAREADLTLHARDQSFHEAHPPEVVVWPKSAAEVSAILRYANERHIPVTAWGAGTSLEGNPLAVHGGIMLSLSQMDKIV